MRAPAMTNGIVLGMMMVRWIFRSEAQKLRPAAISSGSTLWTPCIVLMITTKTAETITKATPKLKPKPSQMIMIGTNTTIGRPYKNDTYGPSASSTLRYRPMASPIGTPRTRESPKPVPNRARLASSGPMMAWVWNVRLYMAFATAVGAGRTARLTECDAHSQSATMPTMMPTRTNHAATRPLKNLPQAEAAR